MKEDVEIHGLDELEAKLKQLELATTRKILRSALLWAAKPMWEKMRDTAPVGIDPKYLERKKKKGRDFSVKGETKRWNSRDGKTDNHSAQVNVGYRLKKVWYVMLLEMGTKNMAPKGWMRRAADSTWQEVVNRFGQRIAYRIKKLEKKK